MKAWKLYSTQVVILLIEIFFKATPHFRWGHIVRSIYQSFESIDRCRKTRRASTIFINHSHFISKFLLMCVHVSWSDRNIAPINHELNQAWRIQIDLHTSLRPEEFKTRSKDTSFFLNNSTKKRIWTSDRGNLAWNAIIWIFIYYGGFSGKVIFSYIDQNLAVAIDRNWKWNISDLEFKYGWIKS